MTVILRISLNIFTTLSGYWKGIDEHEHERVYLSITHVQRVIVYRTVSGRLLQSEKKTDGSEPDRGEAGDDGGPGRTTTTGFSDGRIRNQ